MPNCYTYIIVEDEPYQRDRIAELLQSRLDLHPLGAFSNAKEAYDFLVALDKPQLDLLFLDLQLPNKGDGFGLLKSIEGLQLRHRTIIFTAHHEHAIDAYLYPSVSGYILKPVEPDKLNLAINKALNELKAHKSLPLPVPPPPVPSLEFLVIKEDGRIIRIPYREIAYLEASGNNVRTHTFAQAKCHESRGPFKEVCEELYGSHFLRVHQSFMVNLHEVSGYASNHTELYLRSKKSKTFQPIAVGRAYREGFKNKMKEMGLGEG